jgi:hypothetical protein
MRIIKNLVKRYNSSGASYVNRSGALYLAWGHITNNQLRGDYAEFGVYQGDSLLSSYQEWRKFQLWTLNQLKSKELWRRLKAEKYRDYHPTFHGFDTFEGIPNHADSEKHFSTGDFDSTIAIARQRCKKIPLNYIQFHIGDFCRFNRLDLKNKIAILHIDSDIYESARSALELSRDYLQVGSVILFDDFHAYDANPNFGERRALAEFCGSSSIQVERWFDYFFAGRAYLVTNIP